MSNQEVSKLDCATKTQLSVSYATLLLSSSNTPVTVENLNKVLAAAGLKVDAHFVQAFSNALQGRDVKSFFSCGGGAGAGSSPKKSPAKVAKKGASPKKESPKKEEKKPGL